MSIRTVSRVSVTLIGPQSAGRPLCAAEAVGGAACSASARLGTCSRASSPSSWISLWKFTASRSTWDLAAAARMERATRSATGALSSAQAA